MGILKSLRTAIHQPANPKLVNNPNALMPIRKGSVPSVLKMMRYQDSFERLPNKNLTRTAVATRGWGPKLLGNVQNFQKSPTAVAKGIHSFRDGFASTGRKPLDLSGGVKKATPQVSASVLPSKAAPSGGFFASLDDLAGF